MRQPCPRCKKFLFGDDTFCPECGYQLRSRPEDVQQPIAVTPEQLTSGAELSIGIDPDGKKETLVLKIPVGLKHGSRIRIKGKGRLMNGSRGDLYLIVKVKSDPH